MGPVAVGLFASAPTQGPACRGPIRQPRVCWFYMRNHCFTRVFKSATPLQTFLVWVQGFFA